MDPVSVTAGLVGVTQQLYRIQKAFASRNDRSRTIVQDVIGDLPVYIDILNEMNSTMVAFQGTMPPAAQSCLGLCYTRASRVADLMSKGADLAIKEERIKGLNVSKTTVADLEHAMQQFRQSVSLLRDVTMEYVSPLHFHHLLCGLTLCQVV